MAVYERGETYNYWVNLYDRTHSKVDASTYKVTIYDPCSNILVNADTMTHNDTGEYYYDYNIESTATYGKYRAIAKFETGGGQTIMREDEFFVMPWKLEADIRRKSGIGDEKDIKDDDLSHLAWSSYKQALRELYIQHYAEKPNPNPDSGQMWDGSNTSFQTKSHPIGDINGDGNVAGNAVECLQDVDVWWIDNDGAYQDGLVVVDNAFNGEITITQSDGTAIPSNATGVYLHYWEEPSGYDEFLFREAVAYLGCHHLQIRFESRETLTIADLNANNKIILANPNRYYKEYKRIMKLISKPKLRGV